MEETSSYRRFARTHVLRVPSGTAGRVGDSEYLLAANMNKFHLSCQSGHLWKYSADFTWGFVTWHACFEVEGVRDREQCGGEVYRMTIVAVLPVPRRHRKIFDELGTQLERQISCMGEYFVGVIGDSCLPLWVKVPGHRRCKHEIS